MRDCEPDGANPLPAEAVRAILAERWKNDPVQVQVVPDVVSIRCGRKVGYGFSQMAMPEAVEGICATSIREAIADGRDDWKNAVHPSIHNLVEGAFEMVGKRK